MRGLFVKDIRMALQQKKLFLVLIALSIVLNFNSDSSFVIGYLTFVGTFFVINTISYDEYENGYSFLLTLPVKRKNMVAEKYLFGIFWGTLCFAVGCIIAVFFYVARNKTDFMLEGLTEALLVYFLCLIFLSISLPVQYQFGVEKGKMVIMFVLGGICLVAYLGNQMFKQAGYNIEQIAARLFSQHMVWMEAGLCAVTVVIVLLSTLLSIFIMNKKEF